jgi:hypothetical protein
VERDSDEEEDRSDDEGSASESVTESEQEDEDEEEDVTQIKLARASINTIRLKRLPDALPPDSKTRHAATANLSRYACK